MHNRCISQFLSSCDYVIYIPGGGRTPVYGTHQQLIEMNGREYATFIDNASQQQQQQHRHPKEGIASRQYGG